MQKLYKVEYEERNRKSSQTKTEHFVADGMKEIVNHFNDITKSDKYLRSIEQVESQVKVI